MNIQQSQKTVLGVFDSGVGGLSVLKEIRKVTEVDVLYYGDCIHAPYGDKTSGEIVSFIKNTLIHLKSRGVTHFVSACNSMSVHTTQELLDELHISRHHYIDMIDGVNAITFPSGSTVLIVGTQATIDSGVYQEILSGKNISYDVFVPVSLAGAIETDNVHEITENVNRVIDKASSIQVSYILYACTHYPLVYDMFVAVAEEKNWSGIFVDPSIKVSEKVRAWKLRGNKTVLFDTSLNTKVFQTYTKKYGSITI